MRMLLTADFRNVGTSCVLSFHVTQSEIARTLIPACFLSRTHGVTAVAQKSVEKLQGLSTSQIPLFVRRFPFKWKMNFKRLDGLDVLNESRSAKWREKKLFCEELSRCDHMGWFENTFPWHFIFRSANTRHVSLSDIWWQKWQWKWDSENEFKIRSQVPVGAIIPLPTDWRSRLFNGNMNWQWKEEVERIEWALRQNFELTWTIHNENINSRSTTD